MVQSESLVTPLQIRKTGGTSTPGGATSSTLSTSSSHSNSVSPMPSRPDEDKLQPKVAVPNRLRMNQHAPPRPPSPMTESEASPPKGQAKLLIPPLSDMVSLASSNRIKDENLLVCDYDANVTTLYQLLESSEWNAACDRCHSHPLEVRTWILRRDTSSSASSAPSLPTATSSTMPNKVRWKLLPLHAAVIFQSPTFVISALLDKHPTAASCRDDQGMLPLHLAFRHASKNEALLEQLLIHYPRGVHVQDNRERVPLEHGREGIFSARLMRLYADSAVAGSQAMAGASTKMTSRTASAVARLQQEDHESALAAAKTEYHGQLMALKGFYEEQINVVTVGHEKAMDKVRREAQDEKLNLMQLHSRQMDELRDLLSHEDKKKDMQMYSHLRQEVTDLRSELAKAKSEHELLTSLLKGTQVYNTDLTRQMREIVEDHRKMEALVAHQQEELEAAQVMRNQMLKTLLQQEDEDRTSRVGGGIDMINLAASIRRRIEKVLARAPPSSAPSSSDLSEEDEGPGDKAAATTSTNQNQSEYLDDHRHSDDISAITENSNF